MNDDELKQLWQRQPLRAPDVSPEQLISAMQKQTSQVLVPLPAGDTCRTSPGTSSSRYSVRWPAIAGSVRMLAGVSLSVGIVSSASSAGPRAPRG